MNHRFGSFRGARRAVALGLTVCLVLLSAYCGGRVRQPRLMAASQTTEPERRPVLGRVVVVVSDEPPAVTTGGHASGRCKGAAVGAGLAVGGYLGEAFSGDCDGGAVCGLYAAMVLTFAPVVAIGGAIVGASSTTGKKGVRRMRTYLGNAAEASLARKAMIEQLTDYVPAGLDVEVAEAELDSAAYAVLEIDTPSITGRGSGGNRPVRWTVETRARLVRISDGSVLQAGSYTYHSCGRRLSEWVQNDLSALRVELRRANESLARKIVDEFLLIEPVGRRDPLGEPPPRSKRSSEKPRLDDPPREYFGLRPIEPSTLGPAYVMRRNGLPRFDFLANASTTPSLRWERFEPKAADASRIEEVTYEIRIARSVQGLPAEVIYRRDGLPVPEHVVERRLGADREFFWTIRARYRLDGRPRVTEWGAVHPGSRTAAEVPGAYSYRFRTRSPTPNAEETPTRPGDES